MPLDRTADNPATPSSTMQLVAGRALAYTDTLAAPLTGH
jgi:hypothetical protein